MERLNEIVVFQAERRQDFFAGPVQNLQTPRIDMDAARKLIEVMAELQSIVLTKNIGLNAMET